MAKVLSDLEVSQWFAWSSEFREWAIANSHARFVRYDEDENPIHEWSKTSKQQLVQKIVAIVKASPQYSKVGHAPFGTDWNGVTG